MIEENLNLYKIFYEVAKAESFTDASKALYISQPAISKSIKTLEHNLGTILFVRNSRGCQLTEEGQLFFHHVKEAFSILENGKKELSTRTTLGIGHITIGVSTTLCKYLLLPYLQTFIKENPHIQISIKCQSSAESFTHINDSSLDLAVVGCTEVPQKWPFYKLTDLNYIFVASHSYLQTMQQRGFFSTPDLLKNGNLMLLDKNNNSRIFIDEYLNSHSIPINNVLDVTNLDLILDFCKIGMGIGCVIKEFICEELKNQSLLELPIFEPFHTRIAGFIHAPSLPKNHVAYKFLESISPTFLNTSSNRTKG